MSGTEPAVSAVVVRVAENLGIAFHLADEAVDLMRAAPTTRSEIVMTQIARRRWSLPLLLALEEACRPTVDVPSTFTVDDVVGLLNNGRIFNTVVEQAWSFVNKAQADISTLPCSLQRGDMVATAQLTVPKAMAG